MSRVRLFGPEDVAEPRAEGEAAIVAAAQALAEGALIIHPTSTVYGIGGRPGSPLDERIARIKGRSPGRPLIRVAAGRRELSEALPALEWPARARALANELWPGPLTLVLDDGSGRGCAVRVDSHPVLRAMLSRSGGVMTSTSLNASGAPPIREAARARRFLSELPPDAGILLLAAGDLPPSPSSALVRVRGDEVEILREGAVPAAEVARVVGGPAERGAAGEEAPA